MAEKKSRTGLSVALCLLGFLVASVASSPESRVAILSRDDGPDFHSYRVDSGRLMQLLSATGPWTTVVACPGGGVVANPVAERGSSWGLVFVLAEDGQVYYGTDVGDGLSGKWTAVSPGSVLPHDANATADVNALTVLRDNTTLHLFVKTTEHRPRLYWARANATLAAPMFSKPGLIGGNKLFLLSAAAAAVNAFTHYVEVVAVMTDGKLAHTWQTSADAFHAWDQFSDPFGRHHPDPAATPVLRSNSGASIFNGRLEMFVFGADGFVHHMGQTTCDGVMNPWSECTWGLYERLDKHPVPTPLSGRSPLVAGGNAHGGIELFTVDKSFRFWHLWQVEQGKSYHTWQQVGDADCHTPPTIKPDFSGYWSAYVTTASLAVLRVTQARSIALKPAGRPVPSGTNVTVSWSVPEDEATNADWIGVYRGGDANDRYLDFGYVQGQQNPLHNAVPTGSLSRRSVLGNGAYEYRYLVNRKFVSVLAAPISFDNYTRAAEGTQLYRGLAVGLGNEAGHFDTCAKDANHTVAVFRQAFVAFEDRDMVKGLQLLGAGLKDVAAALAACEETDVAKQVEKFVKDLLSCTHGSCVHFAIDVLGELVSVLYENVHEIYGDIRGAQNCFRYDLYEQAGINIGRVVAACIEGPRL